jgi:proteasome accessory factor B
LVIALLATRRSLTKNEIFRTIDGYDGSEESMERMFERDKDELRSLGIFSN